MACYPAPHFGVLSDGILAIGVAAVLRVVGRELTLMWPPAGS